MYFDFLKYFFKAGNAHRIHSPFVFDFYTKVLKDKTVFREFEEIETERAKLLKNTLLIERVDLGAGKKKNVTETISKIAQTSLKPKKWGQFLFRLVKYYNYQNILDLGTSFGITTSYIAKGNPKSTLYTFDGCPETLKIAEKTFQNLQIENINLVCGNIDLTLTATLKKISSLDLVFFDANHKKLPSISYFETCLKFKSNNACFIFDDIYWSSEMKEAWNYIKAHPESSICIDLFYVGIVFFRMGVEKQSFILK